MYNEIMTELTWSLFPARHEYDPIYNVMDTTSCYDTQSPFSWFSNQQSVSKLAFEDDKGIMTDFNILDAYLKEVIDEIMKSESMFINNILTPIQRNPFEMLRLLRSSDIGNYSHFDTYDPITSILGVEIYLEIERKREGEKQPDLGTLSESTSLTTE
jgi:hypothetical protein